MKHTVTNGTCWRYCWHSRWALALVPLEDYRAQETSNFLSKLYQNSGSKLFAALIESHSLSDRDIQDIKSLLEKEED